MQVCLAAPFYSEPEKDEKNPSTGSWILSIYQVAEFYPSLVAGFYPSTVFLLDSIRILSIYK